MLLKTIFWDAPRGAIDKFSEVNGFFLAQAIAFKALITVIPVTLFLLGVFSRFFKSQEDIDLVAGLIRELIPAYLDEIVNFFQQIQHAESNFTLIGAAGSLLFATVLTNTLCIVVSEVFRGRFHFQRSFFGRYAFSFRLVLQVGFIFFLTIVISFAIQTLNSSGISFIEKLGIDTVWLQAGWRRTIKLLGILVPFILTFVMFFQLYYLIPKPHPPFKSVLLGAFVASVFWEIAKSLFTLYATNFAFFNRLRASMVFGIDELSNTIGLIIALLLWVYYSGIVLIVGSIVVMMDEKRRFI